MAEKYKAAVIGVGRFGMMLESDPKRVKPATHFGLWSSHPKFDLVAVCDTDPGKKEIAKKMKQDTVFYTDPEKLLKEVKPDVISIATWKDTHYDIMKLAIRHKVPVVVLEKPIAEELRHAKEIVEEVKKNGMHLLVNHRRRFDQLLYDIRDELRGGIIGEILQASCYYTYGLVTTGTHVVDTLRFFLGEVEWVSAFPFEKKHFAPNGDPCVDGFIGFENDVKASMQGLNMKDYDIFDFYFYGREGKLVYRNIGRTFDLYKVVESEEHSGFTELKQTPSTTWGGEPRDQFTFLGDNVLGCLEGSATSLSTGEDSLRDLEILLAMQESLEKEKKIRV